MIGQTPRTTFLTRLVSAALALVVAAAAALAGGEGVASASCAARVSIQEAIQQADIVVVGTVTATRSLGRVASVHVEERWKGQVPADFELFGGPESQSAATSVDRTYQVGTRYLLFVFEPSAHGASGTFGGRYEDNGCSATQAYTAALSALRPAAATTVTTTGEPRPVTPAAPTPARTSKDSPRRWVVVVVAGGTLTMLLAAGIVWRGRRVRVDKTP